MARRRAFARLRTRSRPASAWCISTSCWCRCSRSRRTSRSASSRPGQPARPGRLARRKPRAEVRELSHRYGLDVDPDALIEDLPVGIQQRVEIVKALVRQANVLILDEPTAVLTPAEAEELFRIIRQLRDGGTSIIFISHKLKEVQAIADTITVLRRGRVVGQRQPPATADDLAPLMVGRDVQLRVSKEPAEPGEVVLAVEGLTVASEQGLPV